MLAHHPTTYCEGENSWYIPSTPTHPLSPFQCTFFPQISTFLFPVQKLWIHGVVMLCKGINFRWKPNIRAASASKPGTRVHLMYVTVTLATCFCVIHILPVSSQLDYSPVCYSLSLPTPIWLKLSSCFVTILKNLSCHLCIQIKICMNKTVAEEERV